ncbi:hypothetical protein CXG81DRAFT_13924 [Caulochytrium protostelioides]|uniref:DUF1692-domain-containing protein n=1 Tax=Caulochytrium protostelioides TaxID=1555241 RepID=A0A4P9WWY5_9FUNG|nr:DUF1692-domain-containing protein [Caulochytrium protostelioides]RKO99861.1 hypothetical protein CXG81DRAFT_13924 [Caulochytrium protostelioides]|eukprot:RKO99861.1 hypothetical protein CXG81DRAFT_13924 [Caulochytrium protostelioides]
MGAWAKRLIWLDAFPKVEHNIQDASRSGGALTIVVSLILAWFVYSELATLRTVHHAYAFDVDPTRSVGHRLQINFDVTIAMQCEHIRVDVLDVSAVSLESLQAEITKEPVAEFTAGNAKLLGQQVWNRASVDKMLQNAHAHKRPATPRSPKTDDSAAKACRVQGNIHVAKVTGMLHFTAPGHGYMGEHTSHDSMNFTHRFDSFSFGDVFPGIVNPLDNSLEIADSHMDMFQYFISVVPTLFQDKTRHWLPQLRHLETNQYAVTNYQRNIENVNMQSEGGIPGIFIKYQLEPVNIQVTQYQQSLSHFLTRLSGIIGGIFVTMGMVLKLFWTTVHFYRKLTASAQGYSHI